MKNSFYLIFFVFTLYAMEQDLPDTVINIGKTEVGQDEKFVGKYLLTDILPLDLWREIASYLEFDDPALVCYLGPRVGLTKKQDQAIASAFYNNLFKRIKKSRDFKNLLNLNKNCFEYYRDTNSKLLLRELIQNQNKNFLELKNEYSQIHKNLKWRQKIDMRISRQIKEIKDFWDKVFKTIENNYFEKNDSDSAEISIFDKLEQVPDEKLFELSMLLLNLNKLYKVYKVKAVYMSIKNKIILSYCSIAMGIVFLILGLNLDGDYQNLSIGVILWGFGVFYHWFLGRVSCDKIYLEQINILENYVKKEILERDITVKLNQVSKTIEDYEKELKNVNQLTYWGNSDPS